MINPVDRLPVVLKEIWETLVALFFTRIIWMLLILLAFALVILRFADSRDFIILCQTLPKEAGVCPLK